MEKFIEIQSLINILNTLKSKRRNQFKVEHIANRLWIKGLSQELALLYSLLSFNTENYILYLTNNGDDLAIEVVDIH